MMGIGPIEILILLVVAFVVVPRIKAYFAFRSPRGAEMRDVSVNFAWLVVPLIGMGVVGWAAFPALIPPAQPEFAPLTHTLNDTLTEKFRRMRKNYDELKAKANQPGKEALAVPDWILNPQVSRDQILLSSELYSSHQEAEAELLPLAAYLLQRAFQEHHPWQGVWKVPLAQVRERVVQKQFLESRPTTIGKFSGEIHRLHMLINVSPSICETFTEEWKTQIVRQRLEVLGVVLGWMTAMLLICSFYFKRGTHPENAIGWMGHLQMTVATAALTGVAVWVLRTQVG